MEDVIPALGVEVLNCNVSLMRKNSELSQADVNSRRYKILNCS